MLKDISLQILEKVTRKSYKGHPKHTPVLRVRTLCSSYSCDYPPLLKIIGSLDILRANNYPPYSSPDLIVILFDGFRPSRPKHRGSWDLAFDKTIELRREGESQSRRMLAIEIKMRLRYFLFMTGFTP